MKGLIPGRTMTKSRCRCTTQHAWYAAPRHGSAARVQTCRRLCMSRLGPFSRQPLTLGNGVRRNHRSPRHVLSVMSLALWTFTGPRSPFKGTASLSPQALPLRNALSTVVFSFTRHLRCIYGIYAVCPALRRGTFSYTMCGCPPAAPTAVSKGRISVRQPHDTSPVCFHAPTKCALEAQTPADLHSTQYNLSLPNKGFLSGRTLCHCRLP